MKHIFGLCEKTGVLRKKRMHARVELTQDGPCWELNQGFFLRGENVYLFTTTKKSIFNITLF